MIGFEIDYLPLHKRFAVFGNAAYPSAQLDKENIGVENRRAFADCKRFRQCAQSRFERGRVQRLLRGDVFGTLELE